MAFGFEAVVVLAVLFLMRYVVGSPARPKQLRLDWAGMALWSSGLVSIVLGVLLAGYYGWWNAKRPFSMFGRDVTPWGFSPTPAADDDRAAAPGGLRALDPAPGRGRALAAVLVRYVRGRQLPGRRTRPTHSSPSCIAGMLFIVPVFLQSGRDYTALEAGVALLPFSFAILVAALGLPRLGDMISPKLLIQIGTVLIGAGLIWSTDRCPPVRSIESI